MFSIMNSKYIRVFQKADVDDLKAHLLICGDLSASCGHCNALGLKPNIISCPECKTEFKYLTFRNIKDNIHKIFKIKEQRPSLIIVDFDDYTKLAGAKKAQDFFK